MIGGATRVVAGHVDHWLHSGAAAALDLFVAAVDHGGSEVFRRTINQHRGIPVFRIAPEIGAHPDWRPTDERMRAWFDDVLTVLRPDLVHFHCVQRLTASCLEACLAAGVPYIVSVHDAWWLSDYQFLVDDRGHVRQPGDELRQGTPTGITLEQSLGRRARLRPLLAAAELVLAPSTQFADLYRCEGFERTICVPNGISDLPQRRVDRVGGGPVRLGHVGNTTAHKGFSLLQATLRQQAFANLSLIALDHGRDWNDISLETWGATAVEIRGPLPAASMGELYARLDVLVAPSIWPESFGLVTREAIAAGLWVIASDRGAIGADIEEGLNGFVVDVSSPDALARVLRTIDDDPARFLVSPPARPMRRVAEQAEDVLALYQTVLAGRVSGR